MKKNPPIRRFSFWYAIIIGLSLALGAFFILQVAATILVRDVAQVLVASSTASSSQGEMEQIAPLFDIPAVESGRYSRMDYEGRSTVVFFWSTWNNDSVAQLRAFDEALEAGIFSADNLLAISSQEDATSVRSFLSRAGYRIPVGLDESGSVGNAFSIRTLPVTFIVDKNGIITDRIVGYTSPATVVDKMSVPNR